ncbi:hypothetical protein LJR066_004834 [Acidovorax sp. LjRoot66]
MATEGYSLQGGLFALGLRIIGHFYAAIRRWTAAGIPVGAEFDVRDLR